jgi:hypothetical protein
MGSRQSDSLALVRRCEKVGWLVSRNKDGYRVATPRGPVVVHLTYSDHNSLMLARKSLERKGLREAEEKMATARITSKATAARKAEAANQLKFSEAQAAQAAADEKTYAAALARAAGPYADPEDVPITWFAQPHPRPWMRWVYITPEIARYLLLEHNRPAAARAKDADGTPTTNRPLRPGRVEHYKKIILRGQWHLTHQGMAMDCAEPTPNLQDGQHRLQAIVDAADEMLDLKLPVPFFVGMPEENFRAIDEGLNRSAQDLFAKSGEAYGSTIATCIRLAMAFQDQSPRRRIRESNTNEVVTRFFEQDPGELRDAAKFGSLNYKKAKTTAGPLAAARYVLRRANDPDNRYVEAFFSGLLTGRKHGTRLALDDNDPRAVVRQYFENVKLNNRRLTGIEAMSIIVMAWNNVVEDKRPRFVRFTDDTDIPRITLLKDDGSTDPERNAPRALGGEVGGGDGE